MQLIQQSCISGLQCKDCEFIFFDCVPDNEIGLMPRANNYPDYKFPSFISWGQSESILQVLLKAQL